VGRLAGEGVDAAGGERAREWFQVIGREVARMQGILADYLAFARPLQSFRLEPVALGPLVADVLAVLSGRAAHAGVSEAAHGDASVTGDPRRLKEALLNLVANAIDATPAGGRVDVQVGGADGQARIVIRDTGRGMAPEVLGRIGTPFFTTRAAGTGLGVVLARSVLHRHGGGLRYESAPGRGTTVTATLPLCERREEARYGDRAVGR
jgi:two-component system, NtrC family, sensor histidine kinase HydH